MARGVGAEREATVSEIRRCIGCARLAVVDDGVCTACLTPPRSRRWAELSYRVRTDAAFALAVYAAITTDSGRRKFRAFLAIHGVLAHLPAEPS
jgi:hypothetical protein